MSADDQAGEQRALVDVRFWGQVLTDARRTIYCHPDTYAIVLQALQDRGIAHLYTVTSSPVLRPGQAVVVDHQALEASQRQGLQQALRTWRFDS